MWTRSELKYNAKASLKRFWGSAIVVCLIALFLSNEFGSLNRSGNSNNNNIVNETIGKYSNEDSVNARIYGVAENIGNSAIILRGIFGEVINILNYGISIILAVAIMLLGILVGNTIKVGMRRFFMCSREYKTDIGTISFGFRNSNFWNTMGIMFCVDIFTFLWSLLFFIPGVIKSYEYRMIPYILSENPKIDRQRAFKLSKEMMYGQKLNVFVLDLSFLLWHLLAAFTVGILNILYLNPYRTATDAELYAVLREDAIKRGATDSYELPGYSEN